MDCKYCSFIELDSLLGDLGHFVEILLHFVGELNFSLITNYKTKMNN